MTDPEKYEPPLDERVRALAGEYRRPPAVPREAIWQAIQARRSGGGDVSRPRPPATRWMAWVTGIAALVVLGIGIGRMTVRSGGPPPPAAEPAGRGRPNMALAVATSQHLSRAEALLTAFRLGPADSEFAGLARDLLSFTRLLLDSRAGADLRTRVLLEDLELILVQIVQLGPAADQQERQLITDGLEQRQVLPRLRTAIPAGPVRSPGVS